MIRLTRSLSEEQIRLLEATRAIFRLERIGPAAAVVFIKRVCDAKAANYE